MSQVAKCVKLTGVAVLAMSVAGCASQPVKVGQNVPLMFGPPPAPGVTRMEDALRCVAAHYPKDKDIRLAVNDLTDGTGATMDGSALNKVLTQRPDVMMTIGLAKTGVRMVNRSSTGVAEWEIRQAMQKYIGDDRVYREPGSSIQLPYRPVMAGAILGSTHYITGAITELNWNVYSKAREVGIGGLTAGNREYRISLAVDLIVTDSRTTEIVMARSYSKQLVGTEMAANMFRFFDVGTAGRNIGPNEAFSFNIGKEMNEPVQTAVRWILEKAAYDIVTNLADIRHDCDELVPSENPTAQLAKVEGAAQPALPRQPAQTASALPAVVPASTVNALIGVNLFAEAGSVIARIDTDLPMSSAPVVVSETADRLVLELPGVQAKSTNIGTLSAGGVQSVSLDVVANRVRLTLKLKERFRFSVKRQGRSTLIILVPVGRVMGQANETSPNRASSEMLNNGSATSLLEPKRPAPLSGQEQVIPIIQP